MAKIEFKVSKLSITSQRYLKKIEIFVDLFDLK